MRQTISTNGCMFEKLRFEMVQSPLEGLARPSINRSRHRGLINRNRCSFVSRKPEHFKLDCALYSPIPKPKRKPVYKTHTVTRKYRNKLMTASVSLVPMCTKD